MGGIWRSLYEGYESFKNFREFHDGSKNFEVIFESNQSKNETLKLIFSSKIVPVVKMFLFDNF